MSPADENVRMLTETSGMEQTRDPRLQRHLPPSASFGWLGQGWRDLVTNPVSSLAYGLAVFLVSIVLIWTMVALNLDYVLFPVIAGFMIVGPLLAVGLYAKSRAIEEGRRISLGQMIVVPVKSGQQIIFTGLLLSLLLLVWLRAAVLIYALFFGYRPFPGIDNIAPMLFTTPTGWAMLVVGTFVGGLFAALGFGLSAFSVPMLLNERTDAVTAMATSIKLIWNNFRVMITWGIIVLALFLVSVATGMLALIIVFPLLGHATWHAYRAIR